MADRRVPIDPPPLPGDEPSGEEADLDSWAPCCRRMARQLSATCDQHQDPRDCPDTLVVRGAYGLGLPIRDGFEGQATAYLPIWHCPWCGTALPAHRACPPPELLPTPSSPALSDEEIHRRLDDWHDERTEAEELHEYLGWSWEEHAHWAQTDEPPRR